MSYAPNAAAGRRDHPAHGNIHRLTVQHFLIGHTVIPPRARDLIAPRIECGAVRGPVSVRQRSRHKPIFRIRRQHRTVCRLQLGVRNDVRHVHLGSRCDVRACRAAQSIEIAEAVGEHEHPQWRAEQAAKPAS